MAVNLNEIVNRLQSKMIVFSEKYNALQTEKQKVDEENKILKAEIEKLRKELEKSNVDNEYLRLARNISSNPQELAESKAILSQLVRDVDKCIAQLTD